MGWPFHLKELMRSSAEKKKNPWLSSNRLNKCFSVSYKHMHKQQQLIGRDFVQNGGWVQCGNDFLYSEHRFKNGFIHKHSLNLHKLPKGLHHSTHWQGADNIILHQNAFNWSVSYFLFHSPRRYCIPILTISSRTLNCPSNYRGPRATTSRWWILRTRSTSCFLTVRYRWILGSCTFM